MAAINTGLKQWQIKGAIAPHKRARVIFLNISENKSSDRKLRLILFISSAYYVE